MDGLLFNHFIPLLGGLKERRVREEDLLPKLKVRFFMHLTLDHKVQGLIFGWQIAPGASLQ